MKIFLYFRNPKFVASDLPVSDAIFHWTSRRIASWPSTSQWTKPPSEETGMRVQVQGTIVMAVYEAQSNTLILASAGSGDAQAPLRDAQPRRGRE